MTAPSTTHALSLLGSAWSLASPHPALAASAVLTLTLSLLLSGGYAGMVLLCQIGLMPALFDLTPAAFAETWRAMDLYMARRMPPYKATLLALSAAAVVAVALSGNGPLAAAITLSLLLSLAGLVVTIRRQLPLNARLQQHRPADGDDLLRLLRRQTAAGFRVRFALAALSFLALAVGAVLWPVR